MIIYEDDFQPITLDDKPIFDRIYAQYPISHSENSFATLYCWRDYGKYSYLVIDGCLIIRGDTENYRSYRAPIGPRNKEVLDAVINLALSTGQENPFLILEPWQYEWIKEVRPDLTLSTDRNFSDYVYQASDLFELPGKDYINIRKHLNRFRKKCPSTTEPITRENYNEVHEFLVEWCQWRECDKYTILKHEKMAILAALDDFEALGLSGLVVKPYDKIGGLAIYEELNSKTAVVHYEKGLPDCEGIYKEINFQTAALLKDRYSFINRESDMGIPGLREAKERYRPDHLVKLYYLDTKSKSH